MSRRKKNLLPPLVIPGVGKVEYGLKNYLNINDIYRGDSDMQTIIINSFFNQCGGDNEVEWKYKLKIVDANFGKFAQYANSWKQKLKNHTHGKF